MTKPNRRVFIVSLCTLFVLLGMVLFSAGASRLRKTSTPANNSSQNKSQNDRMERQKEIESRYAMTDYDSPDPTDPQEKAKRIKKNKHYDHGRWVMKNPSNEGTATVINSHAFFALPPLPMAESNVVLTADVLNSQAHLSNDKTGVYSEFNVQVIDLLHGTIGTSSKNKPITLARPGGKVRYPSGHIERYEIMHQNMPAIGKRYLFFLKAIPDTDDYEILTGYEIGAARVQPLDFGQFDTYRGKDVGEFLNTVRQAIAKS